jgi:hypothetical protein
MNVNKGDIIKVQFEKPKKGIMPVAHLDDGRICLVDRKAKGYYAYESVWTCEVTMVKERYVFIMPIDLLMSSHDVMKSKLDELKQAHGKDS